MDLAVHNIYSNAKLFLSAQQLKELSLLIMEDVGTPDGVSFDDCENVTTMEEYYEWAMATFVHMKPKPLSTGKSRRRLSLKRKKGSNPFLRHTQNSYG